MIRGSLAEKIFGPDLELNAIERFFYSISLSVEEKVLPKISKTERRDRERPLASKNVAYIDKTVFGHEKNREFFIEKINMEMQDKEVVAFDIDDYLYIKTLSGKSQAGLKNSLFPVNLCKDLKEVKGDYVIIFFDPAILGDPGFDEFILETYPDTERICINECRPYDLLERAYIRELFSEVKQIVKI